MWTTRTGGFPVGFRECFPASLEWALPHDFGVIDLTGGATEKVALAHEAGLRVGAVDLPNWRELITADQDGRDRAVRAAGEFVRVCTSDGPLTFMTIMLPRDPELERRENFEHMLAAYTDLANVLEECDARIVIEGWPGPGALCCTPEGYRAFFERCPSDRIGVNYDPSHLIRMGIEPLRFLREFADRVFHVHAKDTELSPENFYEYGHEIPATFAPAPAHGQWAWRYTIPGHGQMRWSKAFAILEERGYGGCVCVELEDADFGGTEALKQEGLTLAGAFLSGC